MVSIHIRQILYMTQLFKRVASILAAAGNHEWAPGNWSFDCCKDYDMMIDAATGKGEAGEECDVVLNGLFPDEIKGTGLKLSYASYPAGRRILLYYPTTITIWTFLQPFEWRVWLMIFGSSVVVALSVFLLEWTWHHGYSLNRAPSASQAWRGYSSIQWCVTGQALSNIYQLAPRSPGARVVILTSSFAALVLALAYASAYSAGLAVDSLKTRLSNVTDLARSGLNVGIWDGDDRALSKFRFPHKVLLPWGNDDDVSNMVGLLRRRVINALVIDDILTQLLIRKNCDLVAVGPLILPSHIGFAFSPTTPESYVSMFDAVLMQLASVGETYSLAKRFILIESSCKAHGSHDTPGQTGLDSTGGLFIILLCCILLGVLWSSLSLAYRLYTQPMKQKGPSRSKVPEPPSLNYALNITHPTMSRRKAEREAERLKQAEKGQVSSATEDPLEAMTPVEKLRYAHQRLREIRPLADKVVRDQTRQIEEKLLKFRKELSSVLRHHLLAIAFKERENVSSRDPSFAGERNFASSIKPSDLLPSPQPPLNVFGRRSEGSIHGSSPPGASPPGSPVRGSSPPRGSGAKGLGRYSSISHMLPKINRIDEMHEVQEEEEGIVL